jgi:hypothetical protein
MMLTAQQLRQVAARSGARDITKVEIDVILTFLLQLFHETGLTEHLAFKGGTMLRKMVFGPRGRLSTDLDFTQRTDLPLDELMLMILEALDQPYHGLSFRFDRDKDWYLTNDGCAANPLCAHADNERGVKIKLQISTRETPILPIVSLPQLPQDYFRLLPFEPADIPCLSMEEIIAEKYAPPASDRRYATFTIFPRSSGVRSIATAFVGWRRSNSGTGVVMVWTTQGYAIALMEPITTWAISTPCCARTKRQHSRCFNRP